MENKNHLNIYTSLSLPQIDETVLFTAMTEKTFFLFNRNKNVDAQQWPAINFDLV